MLRRIGRVFVDFANNPDFEKRLRTTDADFEYLLAKVLQATATTKFPTFVRGSLPRQFEPDFTNPVMSTRKAMGRKMWDRNFANNRKRHAQIHGYDYAEGTSMGEGGSGHPNRVDAPQTTPPAQ
uniref:Uncharacterized protein n=1 Tax=Globisporangium ultimum (strain ATCC 200006 / CBS 805.95 / DAOM BR144) TaxID=431595 RepID=K3WES7_GLOUD